LGTANPGLHLPEGFAGERLGFTVTGLVPITAALVAAAVLTRLGRSSLCPSPRDARG
jgi:hypothetical protein